jgi:hypothetical protein
MLSNSELRTSIGASGSGKGRAKKSLKNSLCDFAVEEYFSLLASPGFSRVVAGSE